MQQNKIIVPQVVPQVPRVVTIPQVVVPMVKRPATPPIAMGKQEEIIRMIGEVREEIRVNNNNRQEVEERIHEEYQNIIRQMREEHEEEIRRRQEEYQNNITTLLQQQQNVIRELIEQQQNVIMGMIRQHENNIGAIMRTTQEVQQEIVGVRRQIEEIRGAVVEPEREEEEEEISTIGGNRITKERGERLREEEIRILLNRIAKNITTYQQKYTKGEREEQIRNMRETQGILREIQEGRRRVKRGTGIKA